MAEEKTFPMTLEGKKKLEEELEDLKTNKRAEVIKRIKIARSFGDLSENSDMNQLRMNNHLLKAGSRKLTTC